MIWNESIIKDIEISILESEKGPIDFIERLTELQSGIAAWLTDDEHNMLSGDEFVIFVYLTEVIIRSSSEEWESVVSEIDLEVLSDIEEDLWKRSNQQKKTTVSNRFDESLIAVNEKHIFEFIEETIEDSSYEYEMESIVEEFLWIGSLAVAETMYKYLNEE